MSIRLFVLALAVVAMVLAYGTKGHGVPNPRPNVMLLA